MPAGFSSSDHDDLVRAERDVRERIGSYDLDVASMAAISNVFRVANVARHHLERTVLARYDLSFTAFTVLWVVWVWGEMESRHLAAEAGITKGTLTGVVRTLERRGLVERRTHAADRRLVLVSASPEGEATMEQLFPEFNAQETTISSGLSATGKAELAGRLRTVLRTIEGLTDGCHRSACA